MIQKKTLISHFFNEEYLLPWWLSHHKQFFHHGILVDYNSTDSSLDIIKSICPHWKVIKTKNTYFDSAAIDLEIMDIERQISGWKVCLNTTEFLVGDYGIIDSSINKQLLIGNYIFVDNKTKVLDKTQPIYDQISYGFHENSNMNDIGLGGRSLRSIHSRRIMYPTQGGRHFFGNESTTNLYIFYYGYLLAIDEMIQRKLQIQTKMSSEEVKRLSRYRAHPNMVTKNSFIHKILKYQFPKCRDIKSEIDTLVKLQNNYLLANRLN